MPTVSVVIATYNKSSTLRYAIESVLLQSFDDFELWVIGDACTDNSEQLVKGYHDQRVHWHNLPVNSGYASVPNNEGMRRAEGTYIAYLNHDDLWLPNHLEVLVKHIVEAQADFVCSIMAMFFEDRAPVPWIPHYPNAPLVAESSHTLHKISVVRDIGYWKLPEETSAWPRREYFRRAEMTGMVFSLAPMLTALKIVSGAAYNQLGRQKELMELIRTDPNLANSVLSSMLEIAHEELERPLKIGRLRFQIWQAAKRILISQGIDPSNLRFWRALGQDIDDWRNDHSLNPLKKRRP